MYCPQFLLQAASGVRTLMMVCVICMFIGSLLNCILNCPIFRFHDSKYRVFQQLYKHQKQYRELMD